MADEKLEQRYLEILDKEGLEPGSDDPPGGEERRQNPRIKVSPGALPVDIDPWVFAIDVSISGMAFYSEDPVEAGKEINITFGHEEFAEAVVVSCQLEEAASLYNSVRYRLNCRFKDESQGMQMLVRIKEMEGMDLPSLED